MQGDTRQGRSTTNRLGDKGQANPYCTRANLGCIYLDFWTRAYISVYTYGCLYFCNRYATANPIIHSRQFIWFVFVLNTGTFGSRNTYIIQMCITTVASKEERRGGRDNIWNFPVSARAMHVLVYVCAKTMRREENEKTRQRNDPVFPRVLLLRGAIRENSWKKSFSRFARAHTYTQTRLTSWVRRNNGAPSNNNRCTYVWQPYRVVARTGNAEPGGAGFYSVGGFPGKPGFRAKGNAAGPMYATLVVP